MRARLGLCCVAGAIAAGLAACSPSAPPAEPVPRASRNPYRGDASAIAQGAQLYATRSCAACHGADANGGMGPSLRNDTWIYGDDDALLFDLVRAGSVAFRARGHERIAEEPQRGDMPPVKL